MSADASLTIAGNNFSGGGATCQSLVFGTLINGTYAAGSSSLVRYNDFTDTPQDVLDARGPQSGAASYTFEDNFIDVQGFTGHLDGTQFNGGNFDTLAVTFNTYFNDVAQNAVAGTQPFHLEAQLTAALSNGVVAYNTMATVGHCNAGRQYPTGCTVNYDVDCKQDSSPGTNSNRGFSALRQLPRLVGSGGRAAQRWLSRRLVRRALGQLRHELRTGAAGPLRFAPTSWLDRPRPPNR